MNLKIENLEYRSGPFHLEVSFKFNGPTGGIYGPSGAGKTTILELIAGLRRPTQGKIKLDGTTLVETQSKTWVPPERRRIGYVPQDLALFPHQTVQNQVRYGFVAGEDANGSLYEHIVSSFQLGDLLGRYPDQLSGGEKQRVALARALMTSPRLLLLDEPMTNLDRELKRKAFNLLSKIQDEFGIPIIWVSHDAAELRTCCQEIVVIRAGTLHASGPATEVLRDE